MTSKNDRYEFQPIGSVQSPFRQKFGIPRQPGLCPSIPGIIKLYPPFNNRDTVRELDGFSHIWILFVFNGIAEGKWTPLVRPPRLGGNERVGVFASRSTHRPNPIGQSVVRLERIESTTDLLSLHISGHDLLDGTPVLDIKPYLPYSDSIADASGGFIHRTGFSLHQVSFSKSASIECAQWEITWPGLRRMLIEILQQDPRPAYHKQATEQREYGFQLYDLNIRYSLDQNKAIIQQIRQAS